MKYYIYTNENGATYYNDLEESINSFLEKESNDLDYMALGVTKGSLSIDLFIKGKYLKDNSTQFKISTDYLTSEIYKQNPGKIFELINTIRKFIESKSA